MEEQNYTGQRGQVQAVSRAYSQAGYEPATVELVEAHGTSTKVDAAVIHYHGMV